MSNGAWIASTRGSGRVPLNDMVALIKAAQLLLSLSILVVLHELGHYWAARAFKTRVEKFTSS